MKRVRRTFRGCNGGVMFTLLVLLVVAGAAMALVWMAFLPQLVAARLEARTGFPTRIEQLRANPFTGRVELEGLVIENPAVFGPRTFVVVNAFATRVNLWSLPRATVVFETMSLDVARVALVTNTDGTNNLDLFKTRLAEGQAVAVVDPEVAAAPAKTGKPAREFLVKRLELRLGTLELVNLTARRPTQRELVLDHAESLQDVTELRQLLTPALLLRMSVAGASLENMGPEDLGFTLGLWLRTGGGHLEALGRRATDTLKSLFEKLEDSRKP
jgi:hypothetical protein